MNILLALLWFIIGFVLVNGLKVLHIRRTVKKLRVAATYSAATEAALTKTAYKKIQPYTPAYYLIVWLICSTFYFLMHTPANIYIDALVTGILWWLLTLILETLIWMLGKHKYRLSWKEMFMQSQPWLSLDYYAVLISPLILSLILK